MLTPDKVGAGFEEYVLLNAVTADTNSDFVRVNTVSFRKAVLYIYVTGTASVKIQVRPLKVNAWIDLLPTLTADAIKTVHAHPEIRAKATITSGAVTVVLRLDKGGVEYIILDAP